MKISVIDTQGKKVKDIDVQDGVFSTEYKPDAISQYVYAYQSNQRQANAQTKDRSEVRGGGKKPWRQKGTGRARFGSSRVPIWRGGGVTFGPSNNRNFKKKLNKKFKKLVFRMILSKKLEDESLFATEAVEIKEGAPLTKQAAMLFTQTLDQARKSTIITQDYNEQLILAARNLPNIKITHIGEVSAYDILNGGTILIEENALDALQNLLS